MIRLAASWDWLTKRRNRGRPPSRGSGAAPWFSCARWIPRIRPSARSHRNLAEAGKLDERNQSGGGGRRRVLPRQPVPLVIALATCLSAAVLWLRLGPLPPDLLDKRGTISTVVLDRRGAPLYEALSGDGARSVRLEADDLPPVLIAATIAAEDRRFWSHPGIDIRAMLRAVRRNLSERHIVEGGSTITQQTAKLLLNRRQPDRRRGLEDKIYEAVLALRLEHRLGKREILARYLNLAAYGNQVVGAARASRAYFGCDPSMLTPAQAAFLAGLPQRPSGFNPYRHPDRAIARQRVVLRRMQAAGALTAQQAQEAAAERLTFARAEAPFAAPHFVEMVLSGRGDSRPARIETTLDSALQADVAGIIRSHRDVLQKHGAGNVAVVVLDNARGEWLAWEGSGDYFDAEHGGAINGPLTPRQPGSALKPFTYALAFEDGFTPASVLPDVPSHFPTGEPGVLYSPRNYDGRYRGPLLARRALAGSENVPAVALAADVGVPKLMRFLSRAGLSTFDRNAAYYGLGVTLGNAEVRLDQLVGAYSALARGGEWLEPTWEAAAVRSRARRSLVSPRTAFWISDILSDPEAREYIFGRGGNLEFPFPVAVKTGTSQAYHDNWAIGYTRDVTVGVWVGNFDRTPLRDSTGVTGAGPIFHAVMLAAARRSPSVGPSDAPIVRPPDNLEQKDVCALSGMLANSWCPSRQREWMVAGEDLPCSWHHLSDEGLLVVWPAEYRQWARQSGLAVDQTPRPARTLRASTPSSERGPASPPLAIANPPDGAIYFLDPTLRREFQALSLRAVSANPQSIEWSVDGQALGTAFSDASFEWPLKPGRHRITARATSGHTAETTILVK
jgi:penicillin-binding protein 1C